MHAARLSSQYAYRQDKDISEIQVYADRLFEAPRAGEQRIYFKARKGKVK